MTALVIAEHDNATIKGATLNTVAAAAQCGGDVHVLIAGHNAAGAAAAAAQIAGVSKVIHADAEYLAHGLADRLVHAGNELPLAEAIGQRHQHEAHHGQQHQRRRPAVGSDEGLAHRHDGELTERAAGTGDAEREAPVLRRYRPADGT